MKKYTARPHAVDRALLRFGISTENAENWFNQLMQTARLIGKDGKREVYDHKGKRIIIEGSEVVTVINVADLPFASKIASIVEKELKKAQRALAKREKELSIKIAEVAVEQATLKLSYLKAKTVSAKKKIEAKLTPVDEQVRLLRLELERERDAYKSLEIQSHGYMAIGDGL
jgi:hypothetical protein